MALMRFWLAPASAVMLAMLIGGAQAADFSDQSVDFAAPGSLPAVSHPNGKASAFGGSEHGGLYGVTGSFSLPLSFAYGLQVDGLVGSGDSAALYGIGGHLFWRDPAKGLVGLYASYVGWNANSGGRTGNNVGKIGVEGDAYLDRVTLGGLAAYQFGTKTGFAGRVTLAYYPTDNWRLDGSVRYLDGIGAIGDIGTEWQPQASSGLALFAKASFGANDYRQALGGLRFYFGDGNRSLIQRHRQDDPTNNLTNDISDTSSGVTCTFPAVLSNGVCVLPR